MFQRVSAIAGWLALAFIVFATLSPIDNRPVVAGPQFEHFAAFAVVGLAFAFAYPRRIFLVGAITLVSAFGLEALQLLTPDRHARLLDALVKTAGGVFGMGAGQLAQLVLRTQIKGAGQYRSWLLPLDGTEGTAVARHWRGGSVRRLIRIVEAILHDRDIRATRNQPEIEANRESENLLDLVTETKRRFIRVAD